MRWQGAQLSYNLSICPALINEYCSLGELLNDTTVVFNDSMPPENPFLGNHSFDAAFNQLTACERIKEEMDEEYEICQEKETTDCKCYEKVLPLKREFENCTGKASTGDRCFLIIITCSLPHPSHPWQERHHCRENRHMYN